MSHFAKVENGIVTNVIVAEQEFIDTLDGKWIQTSYNTYGGIHKNGKEPLRKNYAGIGFSYNEELDAFIPVKEYASWVLNKETCLWESPVPKQDDGKQYIWNEETISWVEYNALELE